MRKLLRNLKTKHGWLRRGLLTTAIVITTCASIHAQTSFKVSGVVHSSDDQPVAGAVVQQRGGTAGTVTDAKGNFSVTVSDANATLVVNVLGYKSPVIPVAGKSHHIVILENDSIVVDDIVVTALGIKRSSKALGYAVAEVGGESITVGRDANMIQALSGKVAGVDINMGAGGPSGSTRVVIRGNSQLSGSNLPLYVVDGVPMDNSNIGSANEAGGYDLGDGLSSINPEDVESISVLKGASAAALYGSRASNGVMLITTKSAKKGAGLGIDFSTNFNFVQIGSGFTDYQREYGQGRNGRLITDANDAGASTQSAWGAKLDPNFSTPIYNGDIKPFGNINNNILPFFRTGWTTTNSIAASKATDIIDFRLSISDMRNADIVPNSDMSRTTFMLKGGAKLHEKVRIEARANYTTESVTNRPALSDSPNNIGNSIIGLAPNFDQKWLASDYKDEYGRYRPWNGNDYRINPYWVLNEMTNESTKDRIMGHIQLNYDILSFLSLQAKAGTDFYKFRMTEFTPRSTPGIPGGAMKENLMNVSESNFEAMLRFEKTFGDFDLSAFVGGNIMQFKREGFELTGKGQVDGRMQDISNYTTNTVRKIPGARQMNSMFGAINSGYKGFLYVDATIRNDVTSTLAKDNRSYWYPSVSGSFVFSSLIKNPGPISFGKLRLSWAKVGGDTDPYRLDLEYGLRPFTLNGVPLGEISSLDMPAKSLKNTDTYSWEVGVDLRFFMDRLKLDVGYYRSSTKDQILVMPISKASGFAGKVINAGEILNHGIEISVSGTPVRTRDFEWTATVNMSKNINKVISLHEDSPNYELANARWAQASIYAMENQPYGVIVGKKFARDTNGNMILHKGLPTYESKLQVLGNGTYDLILGFGNTFNYKNLSFGFLFDMKFGADLYSMSAMQSHSNGTSKNTLPGRREWYESEELRQSQNITTDNWTPTGGLLVNGVKAEVDSNGNMKPGEATTDANDVYVDPRVYWNNIYSNTPEPYIYDASYIKLRELTLSYNVPSKAISKSFFKGITVTAFARNLWLVYSSIPNIDPESNYNNGNGQGFEYGSLPSRRTYGAGVSLKF